MRRGYLLILIALGVIVFLFLSALLTRALSVGSAEQAAITSLVQAESRGDAGGIVAKIRDCGQTPSCRARAAANVQALQHPGFVTIIKLDQSAGFSLGATVGTARVAWRIGNGLPIVQCVRVRRAGDVLSGYRIELLEISRRIPSDHPCPARY